MTTTANPNKVSAMIALRDFQQYATVTRTRDAEVQALIAQLERVAR